MKKPEQSFCPLLTLELKCGSASLQFRIPQQLSNPQNQVSPLQYFATSLRVGSCWALYLVYLPSYQLQFYSRSRKPCPVSPACFSHCFHLPLLRSHWSMSDACLLVCEHGVPTVYVCLLIVYRVPTCSLSALTWTKLNCCFLNMVWK